MTAVENGKPASVLPALLALSLSTTLYTIGLGSAGVVLPVLMDLLGISFEQAQWIVLAYIVATTSLMVSVGRLGDIVGRRKLLLAGVLLFTAASLVCGLASSFEVMVAARAVQGIGGAAMVALAMALVSEAVPKERTGSAMGLLGTMSAVGTALGPAIGGFLIAGLGWRAVFLFNIPAGLLTFYLAMRYLPADVIAEREEGDNSFDYLGTVLLSGALVAYAIAMTPQEGRSWLTGVLLLAGAAVGACLFICLQMRLRSPLIRLGAFRNIDFSTSLVSVLIIAMVATMTIVVGPFYLSRSVGLNPAATGAIMSIGPIVSAISSLLVGRIVDRYGALFVATLGMVICAASLAAVTGLTMISSLAGFTVGLMGFGVGYVMFMVANNTSVMAAAGEDNRGATSGTLNLSRYIGAITGASALGIVFAYGSTATGEIGNATPGEIEAGLQITFAISAAFVLVGLGIVHLGQASRRRRGGSGS